MRFTRIVTLVHVVFCAIAESGAGRPRHVVVARESVVVCAFHEVVELTGIEDRARPRACDRDFWIIQHVAVVC
eukprot:5622497-Pleurochrysis_carterae.AAC.1